RRYDTEAFVAERGSPARRPTWARRAENRALSTSEAHRLSSKLAGSRQSLRGRFDRKAMSWAETDPRAPRVEPQPCRFPGQAECELEEWGVGSSPGDTLLQFSLR